MNLMKKAIFALAIIPLFAVADVQQEVANELKSVQVSKVAKEGVVLRERHQHPTTSFLIGVPVEVSTGSACTDFVGETVERRGSHKETVKLTAMGATSPLTEACIEIFPMPVKTQLSFMMNIITGGFVPAANIQTQRIDIDGRGSYLVELNMETNRVRILPIRPFIE